MLSTIWHLSIIYFIVIKIWYPPVYGGSLTLIRLLSCCTARVMTAESMASIAVCLRASIAALISRRRPLYHRSTAIGGGGGSYLSLRYVVPTHPQCAGYPSISTVASSQILIVIILILTHTLSTLLTCYRYILSKNSIRVKGNTTNPKTFNKLN